MTTNAYYTDPDTRARWIDLDACNPETVEADALRHGVHAIEVAPGHAHGFPIWRYVGTYDRLAHFLADSYSGGEDLATYLACLHPLTPEALAERAAAEQRAATVRLAFDLYEVMARHNRPDWHAFCAEALEEPIYGEVMDTATDNHLLPANATATDRLRLRDAIADHVPAWLREVTP